MVKRFDADEVVKLFEQLKKLAQDDNLNDISKYCIDFCHDYPSKVEYVKSNIV